MRAAWYEKNGPAAERGEKIGHVMLAID